MTYDIGEAGSTVSFCDGQPPGELELTILMPCLDEAETVAHCVIEARGFLDRAGIDGEVLVADNGSTDGSPELAAAAGARVVAVEQKGYGAALMGGIRSSRGRYVIMGDADDSYDLANLDAFVSRLRAGDDLVIGNRFAGGISPGAMPWLHKRIGNPLLSWIGRLFFDVPITDFHCGLRGFRRESMLKLGLNTTGMEWASQVVVASALSGYQISEVPTTLRPDGRTRPPHLRSFRDGWRHLRFLLLYSPRWLFFYPGVLIFALGLLATAVLTITPVTVGAFGFDIGTLLYAAAATVLGYQLIWFAAFTKRFGERQRLFPPGRRHAWLERHLTLERGVVVGLVLMLVGMLLAVASFARWREAGFGALDGAQTVRIVVPSMLGLILGAQTVLCSLFWSILGIEVGAGAGEQREIPDTVPLLPL